MLLDSHPGHESLIVLPGFTRYRDLAERTRPGRDASAVHVAFVGADGTVHSDTWTANTISAGMTFPDRPVYSRRHGLQV